MSTEELELRAAWRAAVGRGRVAEQRFAALAARHAEPHRRYHTWRHVASVVRHVFDLARTEPVDDLDALVVAACYHDAVYDPQSDANEQASARLAARDLGELGWAPSRVEKVAELIEATATHTTTSPDATFDPDAAVLLDADLAVLAAEPSVYQAYVDGVRAEYHHVPDDAWRAGRGRVLDALAGRPSIYLTTTARERWERRARANLTAERAELNAR